MLLNVVCFLRVGVVCYVVMKCSGWVGCCDICLICDASSWRCSFMGSLCVSSCRWCELVSVLHPVSILCAVFCVTCSLLMFVFDANGDHMVETYSSMGVRMLRVSFPFVSPCC